MKQFKSLLVLCAAVATIVTSTLGVSAASLRDVFNAEYYANANPDVKAVYGNDENALFNHYLQHGLQEGRKANALFDVAKYRESYADLDAAFGDNWDAYVNHYFAYGINEHRTAGAIFDPLAYAEAYPDIKAAFGDDVQAIINHYLTFGIKEGRTAGVTPTDANGNPIEVSSSSSSSSGGSSSSSSSSSSGSGSSSGSSSSGSESQEPETPNTPVTPEVTIDSVSLKAANDATSVVKGETLQFTALLVMSDESTQESAWTWEITTAGTADGTNISDAGLLTVAAEETNESITVKVTNEENSELTATLDVDVTNEAQEQPEITIDSVYLEAANEARSVVKGETLQFTALLVMSDESKKESTWTWEIRTEGTAAGTKISDTGLLTVAADETNESISVWVKNTEYDTDLLSYYATLDVDVVSAQVEYNATLALAENTLTAANTSLAAPTLTVTANEEEMEAGEYTVVYSLVGEAENVLVDAGTGVVSTSENATVADNNTYTLKATVSVDENEVTSATTTFTVAIPEEGEISYKIVGTGTIGDDKELALSDSEDYIEYAIEWSATKYVNGEDAGSVECFMEWAFLDGEGWIASGFAVSDEKIKVNGAPEAGTYQFKVYVSEIAGEDTEELKDAGVDWEILIDGEEFDGFEFTVVAE